MKFSKACETYFKTKDFYEILNISKESSRKEVRKAYLRQCLICHPDRVEVDERIDAAERFKVLGRVYSILIDPEKRATYDEKNEWTDEDLEDNGSGKEVEFQERDWLNYWRFVFEEHTLDDVKKYEDEYVGTEEELGDLKKAYLHSRGDMDNFFLYMPFAIFEHDGSNRIRRCIQEMINNDEVPAYDIFLKEPKAKRDRRVQRLRKEARKVMEEIKQKAVNKAKMCDLKKAIVVWRQKNS